MVYYLGYNSYMGKKYFKIAFTLAEVLITLGIIGIVAAMTIPTLMSNIQDYQFKQAWKKEYSELSQSYLQIINDNGGTIVGAFTSVDTQTDSVNMLALFQGKMKVINFCAFTNSNVFDCFHPWNVPSQAVHNKSGNVVAFYSNNYPAMILGNGTLIRLFGANINGTACIDGISGYGNMAVDVNGRTGPNVLGRDVFGIDILDNKLLPWGSPTSGSYGNCSTLGYGCSYDYLMQ